MYHQHTPRMGPIHQAHKVNLFRPDQAGENTRFEYWDAPKNLEFMININRFNSIFELTSYFHTGAKCRKAIFESH